MKDRYTRQEFRRLLSEAPADAAGCAGIEVVGRLLGHRREDVTTHYARSTRGQRRRD